MINCDIIVFLVNFFLLDFIFVLCLVFKKFEGKCKGKKIKRESEKKKIKNRFKINKLFLYVFSNSFYLISCII